MRRAIGIIFAVPALLIGGSYIAYKNAPRIVAGIISAKAEVPVTIQRINFSKNYFTVNSLQVSNPKKAHLPTALKIETITVKSPYRRYFENPIIIDQLTLDNVYVNIQLYNKEQTEGNWNTIMEHMSAEGGNPLSIERSAMIDKLILTNISIDLILDNGQVHHLSPIKRLEFDKVSSDRGIPTQQVSEIIMKKMLESIFLDEGLKKIIKAPTTIIKKILPFL